MSNNFNRNAAPGTYSRPEKFALLDKLVVAVEKGDAPAVRDLLQRGAQIADTGHGIANGFTALCWAVSRGWRKLAQVLVEGGADVDAKDQWGFTPLMRAVTGDELEIAQLLLEKGASLEEKTATGWTALAYAEDKNTRRMENLLRKTEETRRNSPVAGLHDTASERQERLRGRAPKLTIKAVY